MLKLKGNDFRCEWVLWSSSDLNKRLFLKRKRNKNTIKKITGTLTHIAEG